MTDNIKALDINGVKVLLDDNTDLIILAGNSINGTTTMLDTRDNTKYQVPASKKATIIFVTTSTLGAAQRIIFADDEDGTTNAVTLFEPGVTYSGRIFISAEVPASKFINITETSITAYDFTIIEENA